MKAQRGRRGVALLFLISAVDGDVWSTPRPCRFSPEKESVHIEFEAGWAPGPVWTGAENLASHLDSIPGPYSRTVSRCTNYAVPAPS
jgi:hypothetical protein